MWQVLGPVRHISEGGGAKNADPGGQRPSGQDTDDWADAGQVPARPAAPGQRMLVLTFLVSQSKMMSDAR